MNILYMAFIYACVAAITCGAVFVVRMIITYGFKGQKQWSNKIYWFLCLMSAATFFATLGSVFGFALAILCIYTGFCVLKK